MVRIDGGIRQDLLEEFLQLVRAFERQHRDSVHFAIATSECDLSEEEIVEMLAKLAFENMIALSKKP